MKIAKIRREALLQEHPVVRVALTFTTTNPDDFDDLMRLARAGTEVKVVPVKGLPLTRTHCGMPFHHVPCDCQGAGGDR